MAARGATLVRGATPGSGSAHQRAGSASRSPSRGAAGALPFATSPSTPSQQAAQRAALNAFMVTMKQLEAVVDGVAGKIEAVISGGQNHEQRIAQLEAEVSP